ncbi:PTS sugar transporter subunit IIC [Erysipelothrix urinaevulpis]|uniref:PTS sugar transporter subunit IIC n=1 Tax=Erysipelothrix urinaevulpis TaxID=2683717 RepID=UPI001356F7D4|nr:PTS transporter subunit EIIC [Erysipelothrix urinaevulpis]
MTSKNLMTKTVDMLEVHLGPIASKIEKQRHIQSIKNGMMALISVLMVGSFTLVISAIGQLFPAGGAIHNFFVNNAEILNLPFNFTFGLLALYSAISISYNHSRTLNVPITHGIIGAVIATMILNVKIVDGVMDTQYLDSRGLFVSIIASITSVEIMSFFIKHKFTMRFEGLPEMISQTFESIVPMITVLLLALGLNLAVGALTGGQIVPEAFTSVLAPSLGSIDTVWAVIIISFLEMLFWFIGLNGYAILIGFVMPFMTQYLAANAAAYQAGQAIPHVFAPTYWDYFMGATGSGITGALVILAIMSKRKDLKAIGKASFVPMIFTISEPVVFGLPIAFNPYLFIPFVFGVPLLSALSFMVFKWGIVRPPVVHVGGVPVVLAQYLTTMDWRAIVLFFVIIGLAILMYYPFFKMYERSLDVKDSVEKTDRDKEIEALNLDF